MEWITYCVWRICLEILQGFFWYLMKRKFRSKWGDMLFPYAKRINWKVSMPPISVLWKRVCMSPGHELIGKNARPSSDSMLEFWNSKTSCSERGSVLCISAFKNVVLTICWWGLRWSFFAETVKVFRSLTVFTEELRRWCLATLS